ncbi:hypothetical protein B0T21DRAFT_185475 [Apiosordaria backusii]|uniref:Uncharacterized protein n=1 Tax=Apiosordaria backusii TaxID=314023 RepID=A0AA40BJK8_9PEZI|nr:hypothetical protein B0T21DRAFT_185475 [Apiosordaria backusii]
MSLSRIVPTALSNPDRARPPHNRIKRRRTARICENRSCSTRLNQGRISRDTPSNWKLSTCNTNNSTHSKVGIEYLEPLERQPFESAAKTSRPRMNVPDISVCLQPSSGAIEQFTSGTPHVVRDSAPLRYVHYNREHRIGGGRQDGKRLMACKMTVASALTASPTTSITRLVKPSGGVTRRNRSKCLNSFLTIYCPLAAWCKEVGNR